MKSTLKSLAFLLAICSSAGAQVAPEATQGAAHVDYSMHYSQTAEFGGNIGNWQTSAVSGLVDYSNANERLPLSLTFTGGYTFTFAGPSYTTGLFEHLLISQGIVWRRWSMTITDNVSYRPQAPTTGFSGIPGIGEPIGTPSPAPPSSESILTLNTHVVDNIASVDLNDRFNYATTLSAGGSSELRRYPDGNGLNVDTQKAHAGLKRRLNARNSLTSDFTYSHFSYPDYGLAFTSNTLLLGFTRQWTAKISTSVSAGPQWVSSSDSTFVPSSTRYSIRALASYKFRFLSAGLNYNRGVNDGGGYLFGAESDTATANLSRQFGRTLDIGFHGSYRRTSGLVNNGVIDGKIVGAQASRRVGRFLSAFASYTFNAQSSSSTLPNNVLGNSLQIVAFGIGYSPMQKRIIQ